MLPSLEYINIENTNHCGCRCFFCPREKLTRKRGFMSLERFRFALDRLAREVPRYSGHLHLHGHGEPLLDKQLPRKVESAMERWPECYPFLVSTLAVPAEDTLVELAQRGLREMRVSYYAFEPREFRAIYGCDAWPTVRRNLSRLAEVVASRQGTFKVSVKLPPEDMYAERSLCWSEERLALVRSELEEMGFQAGVMDRLFNFGDGRNYRKPESSHTCSIAGGFRSRQLYVDWELNVVPCCYDYNSSIKFGNLYTDGLNDVFHGDTYQRFINAHVAGRRQDVPLCANCDRT